MYIRILILISFSLVHSLLSYATEPTAAPSSLGITDLRHWRATAYFTPSDAANYLVIRSSSPISFVPIDGISYEKGEGIDSQTKIIGSGISTTIPVENLVAGETYYLRVYAYNGFGSSCDYLTSSFAECNFNTPAAEIGNYYVDVDYGAADFLDQLHLKLFAHSFRTYSEFESITVPGFYKRDTVSGKYAYVCEYSGQVLQLSAELDFADLQYSREHILPKSWMPSYGLYGSDVVNHTMGADHHNLALVNQPDVNAVRSNHNYGEVFSPTHVFLDCQLGDDSSGNTVFEPTENFKGNAARAQFYEMICYQGQNGNWGYNYQLSNGPQQNAALLVRWSDEDPPDAYEIARNEFIYSIQGNRNPFIDYPDLVHCIDFRELTKSADCGTPWSLDSSLAMPMKLPKEEIRIYPNPVYSDYLFIEGLGGDIEEIRILNNYGQLVFIPYTFLNRGTKTALYTNELKSGFYTLQARCRQGITINTSFIKP